MRLCLELRFCESDADVRVSGSWLVCWSEVCFRRWDFLDMARAGDGEKRILGEEGVLERRGWS